MYLSELSAYIDLHLRLFDFFCGLSIGIIGFLILSFFYFKKMIL